MKHFFRFATVIFGLMIATLFIPGFIIYRFQTALIISLIITLIGWMIESAIAGEISPFARGILGAVITVGILLLFSMTHLVSISLMGIAATAVITGTVDLFLPNHTRFA